MGQSTANVSKRIFREEKRYYQNVAQQGSAGVDADFNDFFESSYNQLRRVQQILGDGSPNSGFRVVGVDEANDFMLKGGNGQLDASGRFFVNGHKAVLIGDITYSSNAPSNISLPGIQAYNPSLVPEFLEEDQFSIYPEISSIVFDGGSGETIVTDNSQQYITNELTGREITLDVSGSPVTHVIVSNTATTIRISGDVTAGILPRQRYRLSLTTPVGSDREDAVYLNVYLNEISSQEDVELGHGTQAGFIDAQRRMRLEQNIFVRENNTSDLVNYIDTDGNPHSVFKLAVINRLDGNSLITQDMINDLRPGLSGTPDVTNNQISILRVTPRPLEEGGPTDFVVIDPGIFMHTATSTMVNFPARTETTTFAPVTTGGNVRFDLVSIDQSGTIVIGTGTEGGGPGDPFTVQLNMELMPLAIIRIDETASVQISPEDITDARNFLLTPNGFQGPTGFAPSNISPFVTVDFLNAHDHDDLQNIQSVTGTDTFHVSQDQADAAQGPPGFLPSDTNRFATVDFVNSLTSNFPGFMSMFGGITDPPGWYICDGREFDRVVEATLFAVIGTNYGVGDGVNTFNIPDFRQRFPIGKGLFGTASTIGESGGELDHSHGGLTSRAVNIDSLLVIDGSNDRFYQHDHEIAPDNPPYLTVNFIIKN